jgi:crotonobetainyl-CoA:carnitine CoA-transferase CaiB-like acyl-CoA transferase
MTGALQNLRILDLSRILAGPFCTQILGDLGAEVIKIEKPDSGDDTRKWGPPYLKDKDGNDTTESAYYLSLNRNKKSVAVDITTAEGQAIIHKLLQTCDVLVENFKTGGLDKYGLGYAQLKEKYPRLIYCSITGFGQTGALATEPGYDFLAQALGGLMNATGEPDGQPVKTGVALSDVMTGLYATIGILAALHHRDKTGRGQMIDLSLLDCTVAGMVNIAQYYLTSGKPAPRLGNAHSTIVPYQAFASADGHVIVAVGNDGQFKRFCENVGKPEWGDDKRFATNPARVMHRDILVPMIEDILLQQKTTYWVDLFREADVPVAPVNTMDQVFEMDQMQTREMKISMLHPLSSLPIDLVGNPLKLSDTPVSYRRAPPPCGQDTDEVLKEI